MNVKELKERLDLVKKKADKLELSIEDQLKEFPVAEKGKFEIELKSSRDAKALSLGPTK